MRPGQNKRMRGRNNNGGNRRGPNPLTRSYESNGPDVKIRGTAQHIGEKYLQLARDAQTSGDPVAAENYLQHAEHYFRIIAAAQQAQQQVQFGGQRAPGEGEVDEGDGEDDVVMPDRFSLPSERFTPPNGTGQQPYPATNGNGQERQDNRQDNRQPSEGYRTERYDRDQRPDQRQDREQRQDRDQRQDREQPRADYRSNDYRQGGERQGWDRQGGERQGWDRQGGERNNHDRPYRNDRGQQRGPRYPQQRDSQDYREPRQDRDPNVARDPRDSGGIEPRPAEEFAPATQDGGNELPAFITAPVRTPAPSQVATDEASASTETDERIATAPPPADDAGFAIKPRRRRRARAMIEPEGDAPAEGESGSE